MNQSEVYMLVSIYRATNLIKCKGSYLTNANLKELDFTNVIPTSQN